MAGKLTLISIEKEGFVRIASEGDLTSADIHQGHTLGKNLLEPLLGSNWATQRVLLDLGKTQYLDSAAIGWLIGSNKQFKSKGGALVVHSIDPRIRQMLGLLKVGQVVSLAADEAEARTLLSKASA